ncbi:MAG: beta-ketoacyl-ACP synthase III [Chitinivibrionales bacterium]|nr:beta-ketoacyl-ACP synthase III [Chitinivibrionales bacterium]
MSTERFTTALRLPAQAAAETEATLIKWHISPGDTFTKGKVLAEAESAKSSFTFEAPCDGTVKSILCREGNTSSFDDPVIEIETDDISVKEPQSAPEALQSEEQLNTGMSVQLKENSDENSKTVGILGIGGYLPKTVVTNKDLLGEFPDVTEDYIFGVTGIRERRWANPDERPSDMALIASQEAIKKSGMKAEDIDAIILSTTTPDFVMPATACILQQKLGLRGIPAFDLNAACSGWLYAISVARGMIYTGTARNILTCAVDMQSRLLDKKDKSSLFLFGDGAGAAVISATDSGHTIQREFITADSQGLRMARREYPGYELPENTDSFDPCIRIDGRALFKFATDSFSSIIREVVEKSGWKPEEINWVVPHQANGRILKAAATKSGIPFERFYLNIDRVGNTSSASIPLALIEIEKYLKKNDKIVFCTVGAGITAAAMSIKW